MNNELYAPTVNPPQTVAKSLSVRGRPKGSKNKVKAPASEKEARRQDIKRADSRPTDFVPTTLAQIWGEDPSEKFGTTSQQFYDEKISQMSRADMFHHCTQLSIVPSDNLVLLRKRLSAEFSKHMSKFYVPKSGVSGVMGTTAKVPRGSTVAKTAGRQQQFKDLPEEIQNILDEGK